VSIHGDTGYASRKEGYRRNNTMTEEADLTTQRLTVLARELNELRSSSLNLNGEPDYRTLADAPGLPLKRE
jgi:hypothetical protein